MDGLGVELTNKFKVFMATLKTIKLKGLVNQLDLLSFFFKRGGILIVLDACRYDIFKRENDINGVLIPTLSPSSDTASWLIRVFEKFRVYLKFTRIFSTTPYLNSSGIEIYGVKANKFCRDIIDLWKYLWDPDLQTVHPDSVVEAVERYGLRRRNIIWFIQPHMPYIGDIKIIRPDKSYRNSEEYLLELLEKGEINYRDWIDAYRSNLHIVLNAIKKLLRKIPGYINIFITSDHGEMFGEYGVYFHPHRFNLPQLRLVPFLIVRYYRS